MKTIEVTSEPHVSFTCPCGAEQHTRLRNHQEMRKTGQVVVGHRGDSVIPGPLEEQEAEQTVFTVICRKCDQEYEVSGMCAPKIFCDPDAIVRLN